MKVDYSDEYARQLLSLSAAAFAKDPSVCMRRVLPAEDDWVLVGHKVQVCDDKNNTCAVFVARSDSQKELIVAYRGTVGNNQMTEEIHKTLAPSVEWYGYGLINAYFFHALNVTWDAVEPHLRYRDTLGYNVVFTGYSLGGAMAALAALRTVDEGLRKSNQ
ncbi:Lipase family protein, partial [Aphelenchoides avenae]